MSRLGLLGGLLLLSLGCSVGGTVAEDDRASAQQQAASSRRQIANMVDSLRGMIASGDMSSAHAFAEEQTPSLEGYAEQDDSEYAEVYDQALEQWQKVVEAAQSGNKENLTAALKAVEETIQKLPDTN